VQQISQKRGVSESADPRRPPHSPFAGPGDEKSIRTRDVAETIDVHGH